MLVSSEIKRRLHKPHALLSYADYIVCDEYQLIWGSMQVDFLLQSELHGSRKRNSIVVHSVSHARKYVPDSRINDTETINYSPF